MAAFPLSFAVSAADDIKEGGKFLDQIIIKFYDISMFPGNEKQYRDEVEKVLKDGLDVVTDNVYVVNAEDLSKNPNALLNKYKNSKFIEYAEPNYIAEVEEVPNDTNYKSQSAVLNALNAPNGWSIVNSGSALIAVVDTGVANHTDLPKAQNGYSAVSALVYGNDTKGHGTQVSGVVGAITNNGIGVAGINWKANILPVKVDDAAGVLSIANIAKGIMWAADNGAKIINLSLGSQSDSVTLKNAVDYAYKKGCAIFAASGNEGVSGVSYPARYSNVLAVGSSTNGTSRASISNYGAGLDVVGIGTYYTTTASGGYAIVSGTSFASPQAAALAALMLELDPTLTNDQIYSLIRQGAKPLGGGYNDQTGYGLIDIGKTLSLVSESVKPTVKDTTAPVLTLRGRQVMEIMKGDIFIEPGYTATDNTDGDITNKVAVTGTVDVNTPGVYRLEYKVSDTAGNTSTAARTVEVMFSDTAAPVLTLKGNQSMLITQGNSFIEPGYTATDDVDGDITGKVTVTGTVNVNVLGEYKLEYRVSDTAGNSSTATRVVEIVAEDLPKQELPVNNPPANIDSGTKSFLIEAAAGNRNNYNGSVGYEFECLEDMTVSLIGRPLNGSTNFSHKIYIWDVKTMTLMASAEVQPDSPLDALGFKTAQLDKTITLKAGEKYRIVSSETVGGDRWYDVDQAYNLIPNIDCRITTPVYTAEGVHNSYPGNAYNPGGIKGYVGVTFYYSLDSDAQKPVTPPESNGNLPSKPEYNTPPVITLAGSLDVSLFVNEEYIETGYRAVDCYGVDLTGAVRVTNNINIWTPGIYKIDYIVEDAGGNTARATRTVLIMEREVQLPPATAPKLTIIGSDPIILHLDSGTPYTEQGAYAYDEADGDISDKVQITGSVDRNRPGTYTIQYKVVNSAGLEATAARTVRIIAPNEEALPRQPYNFSGQGKAASTTTHKNVIADAAGWMDFSVTSLDKGMTIKVEVKNQSSGAVVYTNTYTGVGGTQFWVDEGKFDVNVTISACNGNSKYGIKLVTPEVLQIVFTEEEVPLFNPELVIYLINEGATPLEISLNFSLPLESLNEFYKNFIAAGWTEEDLAWFGLENIQESDEKEILLLEQPNADTIITHVVVNGDNLAKIAQKYLGDSTRWQEIYDMNKDVIGKNSNLIYPGQVLKIKI